MADAELVQKMDIVAGTVTARLKREPKSGRGASTQQPSGDITPERFVILLVEAEKRLNAADGHPSWKGCHWIFSGAREAFRTMFPDTNDRAVTDAMVTAGTLFRYTGKGGPTFYLPEDWGRKDRAKVAAVSSKATTLVTAIRDVLKAGR